MQYTQWIKFKANFQKLKPRSCHGASKMAKKIAINQLQAKVTIFPQARQREKQELECEAVGCSFQAAHTSFDFSAHGSHCLRDLHDHPAVVWDRKHKLKAEARVVVRILPCTLARCLRERLLTSSVCSASPLRSVSVLSNESKRHMTTQDFGKSRRHALPSPPRQASNPQLTRVLWVCFCCVFPETGTDCSIYT